LIKKGYLIAFEVRQDQPVGFEPFGWLASQPRRTGFGAKRRNRETGLVRKASQLRSKRTDVVI
jgi:hypothetical protein